MKKKKSIREKKINGTKSKFFENINKVDKPLARLTEQKIYKTNISNERRDITIILKTLKEKVNIITNICP